MILGLDIPDSEFVRLQVRMVPNTLVDTVWKKLVEVATTSGVGLEGEEMHGVAPRSKFEKSVLKRLWKAGVIGDPPGSLANAVACGLSTILIVSSADASSWI